MSHLPPSVVTWIGTVIGLGAWLQGVIVESDDATVLAGILVVLGSAILGLYQRGREIHRAQNVADAQEESATWEAKHNAEAAAHSATKERLAALQADYQRLRTELDSFHDLYQEALNQRWTQPPTPRVPPCDAGGSASKSG